MTDHTETLWRAIEGALGHEKRAALQYAPLHRLLGAGDDYGLAQAATKTATASRLKHAENTSIMSGLRALRALAPDAPAQSTPTFLQKVAIAYKLRRGESVLQGEQKIAAVQLRRALGYNIMDTVKAAGDGGILANIAKSDLARDLGKKALGATAVGAGASVPLVAGGSYLSDKFTEDARNRALQTAGGVAGIGLLGYGGKTLIDQAATDRSRDRNFSALRDFQKRSAVKVAADVYVSLDVGAEKLAHVATCVYLDTCLASRTQDVKTAALRELNHEFLVELLATSDKTASAQQMHGVSFYEPLSTSQRALGGIAGGATGAGIGSALGGLAGMYLDKDKSMFETGVAPVTTLAGGALGGVLGGALGAYPDERAGMLITPDPKGFADIVEKQLAANPDNVDAGTRAAYQAVRLDPRYS